MINMTAHDWVIPTLHVSIDMITREWDGSTNGEQRLKGNTLIESAVDIVMVKVIHNIITDTFALHFKINALFLNFVSIG